MAKVSLIVTVDNKTDNQEEQLDLTLKSLRGQSFRDIEILTVDTGASGDVRNTLDRYAEEDGRFRVIRAEGADPGAAKNAGLEQAAGEFVLFVSEGDTLPERALTDLHGAAKKQFADLVIGLAESEQIDGVHVPPFLTELTEKVIVSRYDPLLHRTTDLAGKLFRREIIEKNNIRFPQISHMGEAVFVYRFSQCCGLIAGCSNPVYRQIVRDDFTDPSLKKTIGKETTDAYFAAFDSIEEAVETSYADLEHQRREQGAAENELEELESRFRLFREDMFTRFVQDGLLDGLYRFLWRTIRRAGISTPVSSSMRPAR